MRSFRRYAKGFTLIELIVVLAIMGILGLLTIPNMVHNFSYYNFSVCQNNQEAFLKEFYQKEQQAQKAPSLLDLSEFVAENPSKTSQICPDGGTISVDTAKKQLVCSKHGGIGIEFSDLGTDIGGSTDTGGTGTDTGGTGTGTGGTTTSVFGKDIQYMNAWKNYYYDSAYIWWLHLGFISYQLPVNPSTQTINAVSAALGQDAADQVLNQNLVWTARGINNDGYFDIVFFAEWQSSMFSRDCYLMYLDGVLYVSTNGNGLAYGYSYPTVEETLNDANWKEIADYSGN
jgi:prepilin-type N-terminal cleavage/methylation domain-containing protein